MLRRVRRATQWLTASRDVRSGGVSPRVAALGLLLAVRAGAQSVAGGLCPAPFVPGATAATALSFAGGPGLFDVPTATTLPDGELGLSFNRVWAPDSRPETDWQNNTMFSVTFLPRVTLTGRTAVRVVDGIADKRDLSANAQLLVAEERGWRPAVMVGANDLSGGAQLYTSTYAAVTKSLAGRVRLTAGYGQGRQLLDGPFGGVELAPCPWLTLIGEHAGVRGSVGVRLTPFPARTARAGLRISLDAARLPAQGWTGGIGVRWSAGPARAHRPLASTAPETPARAVASAVAPSTNPLGGLTAALTAAGLENLRVGQPSATALRVEYENRRWTLDDMEGLGTVLGIVSRLAAPEIRDVVLVVRVVDLPVLEVGTALAPFRAYLADPSAEAAFVEQLRVSLPAGGGADTAATSSNRSRFRLDLSARPRLQHVSMFEVSALETRGSLLPEFEAQLAPGVVVSGRRNVELWRTDRFLFFEDPGADRLLLHVARRMPERWAPAGGMSLGQLSVGRLGQQQVGAVWEQEATTADGRWSYGVTGALYGRSVATLDRSYAFTTVRWRLPGRELRTSISYGKYRFGDVGVLAEVTRRLGLVDVAFRLRSTDLTSQAGIVIGIPIAPRRQPRPAAVRLAAPDFYDFVAETVVFQSTNPIRADVARSLDTGHDLARGYAGRDWLRPGTVRARAWAIRNAALRAP